MWCVSDTGDQDARQYVPNTPFDESKILCRDHKLKKKDKNECGSAQYFTSTSRGQNCTLYQRELLQ